MPVCEKLFVTCNRDKLADVVDSVVDALNVYSRKKLDAAISSCDVAKNRIHFLNNQDAFSETKKYSNGVSITGYNLRLISLLFGCGDETIRALNVSSCCHSDYSDIHNGPKIIFSLNRWGSSSEIMNIVCNSLKEFGDVYYNENDCSDEFIKMN